VSSQAATVNVIATNTSHHLGSASNFINEGTVFPDPEDKRTKIVISGSEGLPSEDIGNLIDGQDGGVFVTAAFTPPLPFIQFEFPYAISFRQVAVERDVTGGVGPYTLDFLEVGHFVKLSVRSQQLLQNDA